jgi:hypothetical protein
MIYKSPPSVCLDNPFDEDVTQRARKLASKLNNIVSRMKGGGVIAIEAQWGDGKTWFAQNWLGNLRNEEKRRATLIDAFQHDFVDDPFAMISAQLLSLLEDQDSDGDRLRTNIYRVGGLLLKASGKAIGKALMKHTIGEAAGDKLSVDIQDAIAESSGEAADKLIENQINAIQSAKESIESLKAKLQELASRHGPIVVMIDELDRCRPDFAVRTLERIKHFFEVPGVVFVLFINREVLASSINGVYGLGEDLSESYLSKFIHLSLRLPVHRPLGHTKSTGDLQRYWDTCYARFQAEGDTDTKEFRDLFCSMASTLGMSFRDLERAITLYLVADKAVKPSLQWLAWPIICKLHNPEMFDSIRSGRFAEAGVHDLLTTLRRNNTEDKFLSLLASAHSKLRELPLGSGNANTEKLEQMCGGESVERIILKLFEAVDL